MRNGSLWSNVVFKKEVISHWIIWIELETWGLEIKLLKAQGCLFFKYFTQFLQPIEFKFHRFVILCIEIHQVRRRVFDNYQRCSTVPLKLFILSSYFSFAIIRTLDSHNVFLFHTIMLTLTSTWMTVYFGHSMSHWVRPASTSWICCPAGSPVNCA